MKGALFSGAGQRKEQKMADRGICLYLALPVQIKKKRPHVRSAHASV